MSAIEFQYRCLGCEDEGFVDGARDALIVASGVTDDELIAAEGTCASTCPE